MKMNNGKYENKEPWYFLPLRIVLFPIIFPIRLVIYLFKWTYQYDI